MSSRPSYLHRSCRSRPFARYHMKSKRPIKIYKLIFFVHKIIPWLCNSLENAWFRFVSLLFAVIRSPSFWLKLIWLVRFEFFNRDILPSGHCTIIDLGFIFPKPNINGCHCRLISGVGICSGKHFVAAINLTFAPSARVFLSSPIT